MAIPDFTQPHVLQEYMDMLTAIRDMQTAQATLFATTDPNNKPLDLVRYNKAASRLEIWNGTAYEVPKLAMDISGKADTAIKAETFQTDRRVFTPKIIEMAGGTELFTPTGACVAEKIGHAVLLTMNIVISPANRTYVQQQIASGLNQYASWAITGLPFNVGWNGVNGPEAYHMQTNLNFGGKLYYKTFFNLDGFGRLVPYYLPFSSTLQQAYQFVQLVDLTAATTFALSGIYQTRD